MRHYWLGSILLSTALSAAAATLGPHDGAAFLGRPLDLQVRVTLAAGESLGELCIRPEVFYGDSQVYAGNVTATLQPGPSGTDALLLIRSSQPINEPIVTVTVGIGCASVFSRQYVLLPDPISAVAESTGVDVPAVVVAPAPQAEPLAPPPGRAAASAAPRRLTRPAAPESAPASASRASAAPKPAASKPEAPAARPAAPRLELDLLDIELAAEREPVLKLSPSLLSDPLEASPRDRQAAVQLWKALNAAPEEILRDQQRLETLEAELKTLRELEAGNRERMMALEARLQEGERLRWINYALVGALLLALVAALWQRRRAAAPSREEVAMPAWAGAAPRQGQEHRADEGAKPASGQAGKSARRVATPVDIDLNLDDGALLLLDAPPATGKAEEAHPKEIRSGANARPAQTSVPPLPPVIAARSIATEELFDVQQQADFFMSLGEHDQAIRVLREHLEESHEPSPLTYLDLFKIYHELGRRDEYEALRAEFNEVFNAGAPPFEQYSTHRRGLESYETAFSRIQALWPQPKVLDLIERSIFRDNQVDGDEVFDLQAYRELLLLYAIAKDIIERDATPDDVQNDFQHTALKPLNAASVEMRGVMPAGEGLQDKVTEPMDDHLASVPSNIGLDIDLDAFWDVDAFEASLPPENAAVVDDLPAGSSALAAGDAYGNLVDFEMIDFTTPDPYESDKGAR